MQETWEKRQRDRKDQGVVVQFFCETSVATPTHNSLLDKSLHDHVFLLFHARVSTPMFATIYLRCTSSNVIVSSHFVTTFPSPHIRMHNNKKGQEWCSHFDLVFLSFSCARSLLLYLYGGYTWLSHWLARRDRRESVYASWQLYPPPDKRNNVFCVFRVELRISGIFKRNFKNSKYATRRAFAMKTFFFSFFFFFKQPIRQFVSEYLGKSSE